MENEKELIIALIKLLESEMRVIEGDIILEQVQNKEEEDIVFNILDINSFNSLMKAIDTKINKIKSFHQKEGMYEAYSKVCELIEKFSNKNIKK